jgi:hypothetical protein
MRRLLLLLLVLVSPALAAQTVINHCVAGNGTPVFTDRPCGSMGATLVATIGGDGRRWPTVASPSGPPGFCPASPDVLKSRVAAAFERRDSNALAGLMLWRGYGQRAAKAGLRHLRTLVREPLLGFGDQASPDAELVADEDAVGDGGSDGGSTLTVYLGSVGSQRQASFDIVPRAGCLWLQP